MRKPKISADEFAERVNEEYDGRISIVKETYTGTRHQVTAYCNIHKIYFEVKRAHELKRHEIECPKCRKEQIVENNKKFIKKWEDVLKSFKEKYGDKFSYDESSYKRIKELIKVHCNDCGTDFEITPIHHLVYNNGGCPNCTETKIAYCTKCGKPFFVNKRVSIKQIYCDSCKELLNNIQKKNYTRCPFCGQYHKHGEQCENQLCREHNNINWFKNLIPFGFDYSKIGTIDYIEEYYKAMCVLLIEYYDNMLSPRLIYEKYNCSEYINSDVTIKYIIKSAGFKVRNRSEAAKNAILTGVKNLENITTNRYKTEVHHSWDGKECYMRSSYEIEFANLLDENKILYEVEALRINYFDTQRQYERIAIPDFYLPETNTIVEIKSSWTLDLVNMLDKVKKYKENGYEFKLILEHKEVDIYSLIDKPTYKAKGRNHTSLKRERTIIKGEKWRWMNNSISNYKVPESLIKEYEERGFAFGRVMYIKNESNSSNPPTSSSK